MEHNSTIEVYGTIAFDSDSNLELKKKLCFDNEMIVKKSKLQYE